MGQQDADDETAAVAGDDDEQQDAATVVGGQARQPAGMAHDDAPCEDGEEEGDEPRAAAAAAGQHDVRRELYQEKAELQPGVPQEAAAVVHIPDVSLLAQCDNQIVFSLVTEMRDDQNVPLVSLVTENHVHDGWFVSLVTEIVSAVLAPSGVGGRDTGTAAVAAAAAAAAAEASADPVPTAAAAVWHQGCVQVFF